MKKVFLTAAVIASMAIASASITPVQAQTTTSTEQTVEQFVKIELTALPDAVKEVINKEFQGSTIKEAFENKEAKLYKVVITLSDEKEQTVLYNEKGEAQKEN